MGSAGSLPSRQDFPTQEWTLPPADAEAQRLASDLAAQLGCPATIARLLVQRGIQDIASAQRFFSPSLEDLHDPLQMLGMATAVERIRRAVESGEPILIYGDYDVDGTTATVLLKTAIERLAVRIGPKDRPIDVRYHVPHRLREGYGIQANVLGLAAGSGIRLVISVDTGIRAFAAAAEAKSLGLDLIVTDHHLPDDVEGIPEAVAVINPAQPGCPYPFKHLCGAAVAFKLAQALLEAEVSTKVERATLREKLLPSFLKLVAIATIADAVPLEGENRAIASLGLRELRNPVQPGLRALMEVAKIPPDRAPTATEVGFRLGPRINAAGRMDVASEVVELFLTRDAARARELAEKLDRLNEERRATEARALEAIDARLTAMRGEDAEHRPECLVLDDGGLDEPWHRGVLGILASRVVERTGRPALVLAHEGSSAESQAHGSGRSVEGFHLLDGLTAVHSADVAADGPLFDRFGGHAHAVGFSLPSEKVPLLRERMTAYSTPLLDGPALAPRLACDAEVPLDEMTSGLFEWLERCGPFGNGNPEPILVSRGVRLTAPVRRIKERHVSLQIGSIGGAASLKALGWSRGFDWAERCAQMGLNTGSEVDLAFRLRRNANPQFGGLELELVDLSLSRH